MEYFKYKQQMSQANKVLFNRYPQGPNLMNR